MAQTKQMLLISNVNLLFSVLWKLASGRSGLKARKLPTVQPTARQSSPREGHITHTWSILSRLNRPIQISFGIMSIPAERTKTDRHKENNKDFYSGRWKQ